MARYAHPANRTALEAEAWDLVRQVPPGRVTTYGRVAALLSLPAGMDPATLHAFGARWVGGAMAHCPDDVPWWRVVNARGVISERPGAERQRALLVAEGVVFDERGRVDLRVLGWPPPEDLQ